MPVPVMPPPGDSSGESRQAREVHAGVLVAVVPLDQHDAPERAARDHALQLDHRRPEALVGADPEGDARPRARADRSAPRRRASARAASRRTPACRPPRRARSDRRAANAASPARSPARAVGERALQVVGEGEAVLLGERQGRIDLLAYAVHEVELRSLLPAPRRVVLAPPAEADECGVDHWGFIPISFTILATRSNSARWIFRNSSGLLGVASAPCCW